MVETSTTLAAVAHTSATKQRRRRGWRVFWLALAAIFLLLLLIPGVVYIAWQAYGRRLLQEQVDLIQQRGEPLTTAEMEAWYAVPNGERDITEIWLEALKPFETPEYREANQLVPIVGTFKPASPLDQPWPEEPHAKDYLDRHAATLQTLHAAAREQGVVRFPRNFQKGAWDNSYDPDTHRQAWRALSLQFHFHLRHGQVSSAIESLDSQAALAQTLRDSANVLDYSLRCALINATLYDVQAMAAHVPLTDEQLVGLQEFVRNTDIDSGIDKALLGERAELYHAYHIDIRAYEKLFDLAAVMDGNHMPSEQVVTKETTHHITAILRPEDCATSLAYINVLIDLTKEPLPQPIDSAERMIQELELLEKGPKLDRFRYRQTLLVVTSAPRIFYMQGVSRANRDITDTLLAARRFELAHKRLPSSLTELVPNFLPTVPIDSFDGQPLRLNLTEGTWRVYSIGIDRVDNGGKLGRHPDNAAEIQAFPAQAASSAEDASSQ